VRLSDELGLVLGEIDGNLFLFVRIRVPRACGLSVGLRSHDFSFQAPNSRRQHRPATHRKKTIKRWKGRALLQFVMCGSRRRHHRFLADDLRDGHVIL
jgi:hypothetical protein